MTCVRGPADGSTSATKSRHWVERSSSPRTFSVGSRQAPPATTTATIAHARRGTRRPSRAGSWRIRASMRLTSGERAVAMPTLSPGAGAPACSRLAHRYSASATAARSATARAARASQACSARASSRRSATRLSGCIQPMQAATRDATRQAGSRRDRCASSCASTASRCAPCNCARHQSGRQTTPRGPTSGLAHLAPTFSAGVRRRA